MKKIKILNIALVLIISIVALPVEIEAKTLADFEAEVAKYTAELQAKKDKVAKNDAEVAEIKKKITEIENQITQTKNEISTIEAEIEKSNKEIEEKEKESKKIMKYFQLVDQGDSYLEYIFGSKSIEDMIRRVAVIQQLTEYNQKIIKELTDLIEKNKQQKTSLEQKTSELNSLQKSLKDQKERIDADSASIRAGMPAVEEQIKAAKAQVSQLKQMGCSKNEDISTCTARYYSKSSSGGGASIPSTNGFYRPMEYGYVTQGYKGRSHMGIDLSSSNKAIPIYPIASGQVSAKYYDNAGALVVKVRHNVNGRIIYSTYAHLRSFSVSENQYVSHTTQLGLMGSTGYSTGPHLHLEVTSCDWKSFGGGCTWSQYQNSTINPGNYVSFPSRWNNR